MDLLSLFTTANEAGLSIGSITTVVIMCLKIESGIKKREQARVAAELIKEAKREAAQKEFSDKIVDALTTHDKKNEIRFLTIETHIGIKK